MYHSGVTATQSAKQQLLMQNNLQHFCRQKKKRVALPLYHTLFFYSSATGSSCTTGAFSSRLKSPSLIQPILRNKSPNAQVKTAGNTKQIKTRPNQSIKPGVIAEAPWPVQTRERREAPTAAPFISILKRQVARGPVIALAIIGGSHTLGFLIMLGICSILVPSP